MGTLREDYAQKRVELWTTSFALAAVACMTIMFLVPPTVAPKGGVVTWMVGLPTLSCLAGAVICGILSVIVRPLRGFLVLAISLGLLVGVSGFLSEKSDALWQRQFEETGALREEFLAFMKETKGPEKEQKISLPPSLKGLAAGNYAYRHEDDRGNVFYAYSVLTHAPDNCRGYAWSESGLPPPRLAYPEIITTRPLGDGWFEFGSS